MMHGEGATGAIVVRDFPAGRSALHVPLAFPRHLEDFFENASVGVVEAYIPSFHDDLGGQERFFQLVRDQLAPPSPREARDEFVDQFAAEDVAVETHDGPGVE